MWRVLVIAAPLSVVWIAVAHKDAPIYVLHGAWLDEEIPTLDYFDHSDAFDAGIVSVTPLVLDLFSADDAAVAGRVAERTA